MPDYVFPKDFIWGTATASYQIEGAVSEDGRGESIWDRFCQTPGKVFEGHTGDVACDHYHRYRQDVAIMKEMGLKGYRFSIAWPRIYPQGCGKVNQKGLDFYSALVDELLNAGIEPAATLYHWDLPQALQDIGGWASRDTVGYYVDYAAQMFRVLGDRVNKWITHNEPWVVAFLGNALAHHAPGLSDMPLAVNISHNIILSHAKAIKAYRQLNQPGRIGITLNLNPAFPASDSREDMMAATIADGFNNRWFLDPIFKGKYPEDMLKFYQEHLGAPEIKPMDMEIISESPVDFLGVNYYSRAVVKKSDKNKPLGIEQIRPDGKYTDMDWEIYPRGLFDLLTRISNDYGSPDIYITENGAAFKDHVTDEGRVNDDDRLDYLKNHFIAAHDAIKAGVKLKGYYVWTLMDNFEWAFGYGKRFGIVHTDYETLKRTWKKSACWYKDVIANNGL